MKYYDIGVNAAANSGFLALFVSPVLVIVLYFIAATCLYVARRFLKSRLLGVVVGIPLLLLAGVGAFLLHVYYYADYPTETAGNMRLFLDFYVDETYKRE